MHFFFFFFFFFFFLAKLANGEIVFITAQGFFKLRFTGSPYEDNFQNYFSIGFMGTNLLVVGSSILIQKQVK
jgi:equilibrative nucleoside transporter 1/2/3